MDKIFPHVTIIILNWKRWSDTIECLESVLKSGYHNYSIVLIDNGSDNESVEMIQKWAKGSLDTKIITQYPDLIFPLIEKPIKMVPIICSNGHYSKTSQDNNKYRLHFLMSDENLGFAVANNMGIRYAKEVWDSQYFYLLNNDTVIEKNTLECLVDVLENNFHYGAAQSTIYYYHDSNKIANAGGQLLFLGKAKFYNKIGKDEIKEIGFINGCAILISKSILTNSGIFTERFFFGEEDFELSLRLKKHKIKKVCVGLSRVYHKISISSEMALNNDNGRKLVISALNRIADLKSYYPRIIWYIWRSFTIAYYYYFLMIIKKKIKINLATKYLQYIIDKSRHIDSVDKILYYEIMNKRWI